MRIIVDCNVIISAGLGSEVCFSVLKKLESHQIVLSNEIFSEYNEVISREKFKKVFFRLQKIIHWVYDRSLFVEEKKSPFSLLDKDDQVYIDVAFSSEAEILITGNKKHFPEEKYGKTLIVTPREFLDSC